MEDPLLTPTSNVSDSWNFRKSLITPGIITIVVAQCVLAMSYYGLVSVLSDWMNEVMGYSESESTFWVNTFGAFNFLCALGGGLVSDAKLGKHATIVHGCFTCVAGYCILFVASWIKLSISDSMHTLFAFLGLVLVAVGNGAATPCISNLVGDQLACLVLEEHDRRLIIESFYRWFYLSFNLGAVVAQIAIPAVSPYELTFGLIGGVAILSLPAFFIGRPSLARESKPTGVWKVDDKQALWSIIRVFAPLPVFWALFFNMPGLWTFTAKHMDRTISDVTIPEGNVQALNPLLDMILIPVFDRGLYPGFRRVFGFELRPITRMTIGMVFSSLALFVASIVQHYVDVGSPDSVPVFWQIPQYALMSCGEIMVSITSIEFAYTQAPESMKGLIMALVFLTQAIGNLLVALLQLIHITDFWDYILFGGIMFIFMLIFNALNRSYHYVEDAKDDE